MGEVHKSQVPESSLHWNWQDGSLQLNSKVAELVYDGFSGLRVMKVSGGIASMVQVQLAGVGSILLNWSMALTSKVCSALERPL